MKMRRTLFFPLLLILTQVAVAQNETGPMDLRQCVDYSIQHNIALQKDRLLIESAVQSRREIIGSMLPQVNASGSMTYNIQKTTIAMPNFVNSMMPESMRDPNAPKYMTVTMGMDLGANWGVSLTQQLLNFSLFNAISIAKEAEEMSRMGVQADMDNVIAQVGTLFYNVQILQYSIGLFEQSLDVMRRMADMMETNRAIGLVRNVDADRIQVTKMNLETEKSSLLQALDIQKNLLKLEMGFPMNEDISVEPLDVAELEYFVENASVGEYVPENQLPFKIFKKQQGMIELQRKSAISETLPMLSLNANYSQNYMGDHFYGETFHHFPVSMVSLSLRFPIFSGMSKNAKIKKATIELDKSLRDETMLLQSLTMGYNNAIMQVEQNKRNILSQKRNSDLAQNVLSVTESNYKEGLASLSDLLNASSSLIESQLNYVDALNKYVKAFIDIKKANGTISELIN